MRLLDVGAHDGFLSLFIQREFPDAHIDAIELNETAAAACNKRINGTCKIGAAEDAPNLFQPGTYDHVMAGELIEHVPDIPRFLSALEQMVTDTGRITISTPAGTFGAGMNPHHLRCYRAIDLADLLRRRGLLLDMEVGSDGIVSASYTPRPRLDDIAIYCGPGWEPWHPADIETRGLGGSETAAVRLAECLSDLGFVVTVYGELREDTCWKQVIFRHHLKFDPLDSRGALICSRLPEIADRPIAAAVRMLWVHDVDCGPRLTPARADAFDHVLTLSGWHERHIAGRYPFLADKIVRTRNGIHQPLFKPEAWNVRVPRVLYTSSPDRGLDILLGLWPRIREQVPDAELVHVYAAVYDKVADQDPAVGEHRDRIRKLGKQPGVVSLGSLGQRDLAALMCASRVWCHPSWMGMVNAPFHETSCLSGDTLVDMPRNYRTHPDGIPIADLEGESGFPVWAWNEETHRFTIATAKRCWKSRESARTVRITFEEGTVLTCTPDHKVLTFDGDWVEAASLLPGDRMRGLNYRFQVNVNLGDGRWTAEHRMVGHWMAGRQLDSDEHVHHLGDPTRLDNRPGELEVLPAGVHHSLTHSGREYSRAWKEQRRALSLAWKETPEGQAHYLSNARKAGQSLWEWVRSLPEDQRQAWLSARAAKAAATVRDRLAAGSDAERAAHAAKMSERGRRGCEVRWETEAPDNHRVLSVEEGPTVDVFDMEVEEHHNFVAGGVVVHNCIGAMEAQAAGCLVVASDWGALSETVQWGHLVNSAGPGDARWEDAFIAHIVEGLTDPKVGAKAAQEGPRIAAGLGWDGVAEQIGRLVAAGDRLLR
jgi:glycosyltransferase involved in cell wall biosynthesis